MGIETALERAVARIDADLVASQELPAICAAAEVAEGAALLLARTGLGDAPGWLAVADGFAAVARALSPWAAAPVDVPSRLDDERHTRAVLLQLAERLVQRLDLVADRTGGGTVEEDAAGARAAAIEVLATLAGSVRDDAGLW